MVLPVVVGVPFCSSQAGLAPDLFDASHSASLHRQLQLSWSPLWIAPHSLCLQQAPVGCLHSFRRCQGPRMSCCCSCCQIRCWCCFLQPRSLRVPCCFPKRQPWLLDLSQQWPCPVAGKATVSAMAPESSQTCIGALSMDVQRNSFPKLYQVSKGAKDTRSGHLFAGLRPFHQ